MARFFNCFIAVGLVWTLLVDLSIQAEHDVFSKIVGNRLPPGKKDKKFLRSKPCHGGAICVGPGRSYPIGRQQGVLFQSYFEVPDLPKEYDLVETTYYDYLNIYWGGPQPAGGYMNQLVPQLMLGNALANSTNHPHYVPQWIQLEKWHIGAQYFMGTCPKVANGTFDCRPETWIGHAATGKLVPVEPGEIVETTIELVGWQWHLRMSVVGENNDISPPARTSLVIADRPFMGLVESTRRWSESIYSNVIVGSCLENYGMHSRKNYPPSWQLSVNVLSPSRNFTSWSDWHLAGKSCKWQPRSSISTESGAMWQHAEWNATLAHSPTALVD